MKKQNEKEIIFMEILSNFVQQFTECSETDALEFVVSLLEKVKQNGIRWIIK